jgi:hypothetical protein
LDNVFFNCLMGVGFEWGRQSGRFCREPACVAFACASVRLLGSTELLVAFLGVAAVAGALHLIGVTRSALGIAEQKDADPFNAALGDAHPLDYMEAKR